MAPKRKKQATSKKVTARKKASRKPATKKKSPFKKKAIRKKFEVKSKVRGKKKVAPKRRRAPRKQTRAKGRSVELPVLRPQKGSARSGGQSGDLQGLSDLRSADSESVDELLEEGNAFEADIVKGVEDAGNEPGREVHTHEVLEDDVPDEYLDKD